MKVITKEFLINKNWVKYIDPYLPEDPQFNWEEYKYTVKDINNNDVYLTMNYGLSNMVGRNWSIHIDNWLHEGIGYVDIETIDQFNKVMDILEINYKL